MNEHARMHVVATPRNCAGGTVFQLLMIRAGARTSSPARSTCSASMSCTVRRRSYACPCFLRRHATHRRLRTNCARSACMHARELIWKRPKRKWCVQGSSKRSAKRLVNHVSTCDCFLANTAPVWSVIVGLLPLFGNVEQSEHLQQVMKSTTAVMKKHRCVIKNCRLGTYGQKHQSMGQYSTTSAFKIQFQGLSLSDYRHIFSKAWAPGHIKIFAWLLHRD